MTQLEPRRAAAALVVLLAYLAIRAPFLAHPLVEEEGMFAHMISDGPAGPAYNLLGKVGGRPIYDIHRHPAGLCQAYVVAGRLAKPAFAWLNPEALQGVAWLRLVNLCFQGLVWFLLAYALGGAAGATGRVLIAAAAASLLSPLGLGSSLYLHPDNSAGVLTAGLAALALAFPQPGKPPVWAGAAYFFLGAVGKHEWSLAAALGLALGLIWNGAVGLGWRPWMHRSFLLLAALALGNLCSWAQDPVNYASGLGLMSGMAGKSSLLGPGQAARWLQMSTYRAPFLSWHLVLLVVWTWMAWRARERSGNLGMVAGLAWALCLPFFVSTWNFEYRYFAPSWSATLILGGLTIRAFPWPAASARRAILALGTLSILQAAFVGAVWSRRLSLTEIPLGELGVQDWMAQTALMRASKDGCIPDIPMGWAYQHRLTDFIGYNVGDADAERFVSAAGGRYCR